MNKEIIAPREPVKELGNVVLCCANADEFFQRKFIGSGKALVWRRHYVRDGITRQRQSKYIDRYIDDKYETTRPAIGTALLLAHHQRCGQRSMLAKLPSHIIRDIAMFAIIYSLDHNSQKTTLQNAAGDNNSELLEKLISCNINVNTQHPTYNPLNVAALLGHVTIVKMLIDAGAQVDAKNHEGHKPLDLATMFNHQECIKLLRAATEKKQ